jgi:hypothetical protein
MFMISAPADNFMKLFCCNLRPNWHIALNFDSGYTARGVNYLCKMFMKSAPVANFIKKICHNLCPYQHISLSFDSCYTTRGVNYLCKIFMKLSPVANFIKLFVMIYAPISVLPQVLSQVTLLQG